MRSLDLIVLSEKSVLPLVWRIALGRPVAILGIVPLVPGFATPLGRLAGWLRRSGRAIEPRDMFSDLAHLKNIRYEAYTTFYQRIEPWMAERFGFAALDRLVPDYAQAVRHVTFGHVDRMARWVFIAEGLTRHGERLRLIGADPAFDALYRAWWVKAPPFRTRANAVWREIANGALAFFVAGTSLAFILSRTRLVAAAPERRFLGATFVDDARHYAVLRDIVDADAQVTTIFLEEGDRRRHAKDRDGFTSCFIKDGRFDIAGARDALGLALRDVAKLHRMFHRLDPAHFRAIAKLVLRRIMWRGLFARYRFDAVWGRDDYNAEHIMRTLELRRIGGRSIGINHGLPVTDIIEPGWRYLDFDIYYVFGMHLYERYYRTTWPAHMRVRAVGSFGVRRQIAIAVRRSRDVVFYVNPGPYERPQSEAVMALAARMPERRFLVKVKSSRRRQGMCQITLELMREATPNVTETEEDSYELMTRHGYAITGLSTVAAEAIQLGMVTFVVDAQPEDAPNYYRDFPGLCVKSAAEIEARIRAIESGRESWSRDAYRELIASGGPVIYDVIRADLGLPPKKEAA
jgi:hypothetical protein